MKKSLKALLGSLAFRCGLGGLILRNNAVIVAFHRVSDAPNGDALTCSTDVFAGLCALFKAHFSVIPLSELVSLVRQNEPVGGKLSITFDDGYRDNFEVAAPILSKFGLPATFFVATNFIGSRTVPFWDANDGVESEWMSWAQVAELRSMGFDIGGHTLNHADLGSVDREEAEREIDGCRKILTEKLGTPIPHFAYPFGGVRNITPAAIGLVEQSGFSCCLSCHGGIVSAGSDVYDLPREPINRWVESPYQYGFELLRKAMEAPR